MKTKKLIMLTLILIFIPTVLLLGMGCAETTPPTLPGTSPDKNPSTDGGFYNPDTETPDENPDGNPNTPEGDPDEKPSTPENPDNSAPEKPDFNLQTMIVSNQNGLNIRLAPNASSGIIGSINNGDLLSFKGESNGWRETVYRNQTAFVYTGGTSLIQFAKGDEYTEKIIALGQTLLGTPYVWGAERYHWGNGNLNSNFRDNAFDCSSYVQYMFAKEKGVMLGTTSRAQSVQGAFIEKSDLKRGDVMFFTNASRQYNTGIEKVGHVGIYFGGNYILHTASDYAVIEPISTARWNFYLHSRRH